jgi:hypothetical protein
MGLDMYLEGRVFFWTDWNNPENNPTRDGYKISNMTLDLGYWRKHPDLHGFITREFAGGQDECQDIELSVENMERIIEAIKNKELPHTEGFFFGQSTGDEDETSIDIFKRAIGWVNEVKKIEMPEPEPVGNGTMMVLKVPLDIDPKESRSVIYRASW